MTCRLVVGALIAVFVVFPLGVILIGRSFARQQDLLDWNESTGMAALQQSRQGDQFEQVKHGTGL